MQTTTKEKNYTLTHTVLDTLVKKVLDRFWPEDRLGTWLKYISDEQISDWLLDDVAGMKPICPECREYRPDDDRVKAGMKCGVCAGYGEAL